jgi:ethanolamine utilization protein EutP (predicted NTPase)
MADFKKGDKVVWSSHGRSDTPGEVVEVVTESTSVHGLDVNASEDDPRYVVKSEKSGKFAAHKPDALKRR